MTGAPVIAQEYVGTLRGVFREEGAKQGGNTENLSVLVLTISTRTFLLR